jgi:hypothetical protein
MGDLLRRADVRTEPPRHGAPPEVFHPGKQERQHRALQVLTSEFRKPCARPAATLPRHRTAGYIARITGCEPRAHQRGAVVDALLGAAFAGIVGSDRWSAYNRFPAERMLSQIESVA